MLIAVMGAVDSGKSTFVRTFCQTFFKEKYGRTEQLRFLKSFIGDQEVTFIDCPGHSLLGFHNQVSLALCDAVIYLIDSNNVSISNLDAICKVRPTLVVLNKFMESEPRSLKEMCSNDLDRYGLYKKILEVLGDKLDLKPFFDAGAENKVLFPLNLKTGLGVQEFKKYFRFWSSFIEVSDKCYVFRTRNEPPRYGIYSSQAVQNYRFNLERRHEFKELFKYDSLSKDYVPLRALGPLLIGRKDDLGSNLEVPPAPFLEYEPPSQLMKVMPYVDPEIKFMFYSDHPRGGQIMSKIFKCLDRPLEVTSLNRNKYMKLDVKRTYKLGWCEPVPGYMFSDSILKLLDLLVQELKHIHEKELNEVKDYLSGVPKCKLLHQHTFNTKPWIVGSQLLCGTLHKGALLHSGSQCREVLQIQQQGKAVQSWSNRDFLCALQLSGEPSQSIYFMEKYTLPTHLESHPEVLQKIQYMEDLA